MLRGLGIKVTPRGLLDDDLDVASWQVPGSEPVRREYVAGAPSWWRGDEEASQVFLRQVGAQ